MAKKSWGRSARATTVFIGFALPAALAMARSLPQVDALGDRAPLSNAGQAPSLKAALSAATNNAVHSESRLGVPTFMWGEHAAKALEMSNRKPADKARLDPATAARTHLMELGALYKLSDSDAKSIKVHNVQTLDNGATIVRMRNSIDGVEVFREEANVLMDRKRNLVSLSGFVMGRGANDSAAAATARAAQRSPGMAISSALADFGFGAGVSSQLKLTATRDGYDYYELPAGARSADGSTLAESVRVKKVLFRLPEGLIPAYYVEVQANDPESAGRIDAYSYVIAETDGAMLFRNNLTADLAFSYRVFAEASGLPLPSPTGRSAFPYPGDKPGTSEVSTFAQPNLITLQNWPFSKNDPWLPDNAKTTRGNNVDAYADLLSPDGLGTPDSLECDLSVTKPATDFHACTTGAYSFDHSYDVTKNPLVSKAQSMASTTNLFYLNNFFHDWYYDAGFDEAAGNSQTNNFGRGGLGNDSLRAEAQDAGGINNANMSTPADGARPRMQMFLWPKSEAYLNISAPAAVAGKYLIGVSALGPQKFTLKGNIVAAQPAVGCGETGAAVTNAAALKGNIAYVDRGGCTFAEKTRTAQLAGATGVIVGNNSGGDAVINFGVPDDTTAMITIPGVLVSQNSAAKLKANMTGLAGTVVRDEGIARDGTLDNGVIAHEWGHFISNRMIGNANGLSTVQSRGLGEGWGDFHALLLLAKEEDTKVAGSANYAGAYAMAGYLFPGSANGEYFGMRRYPYSSDMTKNPLTFKHITNGVLLPGGVRDDNAEVHNTGEVWAAGLWQCYSNLLRDTPRLTFAEAQRRMKNYLVGGYKLTPVAPTFVEARDAVLAVARSQDTRDFELCAQGFATRGLGAGALATDRFSPNNDGVTESFVTSGLVFVSAELSDGPLNCDKDGVLDNGETALLKVTLRNTGITKLSATTGKVSSANAAVQYPSGTTINFPPTMPGQTVSATLPVSLKGSAGREAGNFSITMSDTGMSYSPTGNGNFAVNSDQVPNMSATDDVESTNTVWTSGSDITGATLPYRIAVDALDSRWFIGGSTKNGTTWLTSPPLNVDPSGAFGFTFKHRFGFEAGASAADTYDGGLIEITADGGKTWSQIPASAMSNGYNGQIATTDVSDNPRAGVDAFVRHSNGYPGTETVTVDLGGRYAGQTVQIRFVSAGDSGGADAGWEIDNISFLHISNKPFDVMMPRANACANNAMLAGKRANYTVVRTAAGTVVTDNVGGTGTHTVSSETRRITFADSILAMDTNGVPGNIVGAYRAALNRMPTAVELGMAIKMVEVSGKSLDDVLAGLVAGAEFMAMSNGMSNTQFVNNLYIKVLGQQPDRMALFLANALRTGYYSRADLVAQFGMSDENKAAVLAMYPNGVEYTPAP